MVLWDCLLQYLTNIRRIKPVSSSSMRSLLSRSTCGSASWRSSTAQATVTLRWSRQSGSTSLRLSCRLAHLSAQMTRWRFSWARWGPSDRSMPAHRAASQSVSTLTLRCITLVFGRESCTTERASDRTPERPTHSRLAFFLAAVNARDQGPLFHNSGVWLLGDSSGN